MKTIRGDFECGKINKLFWLSVKRAKDCLFSRRNGIKGKIIKGYSIRLRIFGTDLV
ncbi:MAG: hypothetical protein IMZ64_07390 [Bacteroidetes bacterium]|nr:hypothetical protein [Bacteroidota bacterium]